MYYVGTADLAVYPVHTPQGNILINSDFEEDLPVIKAELTVDVSKTPRLVQFSIDKSAVLQGIFEFSTEGDLVKLCMAPPGMATLRSLKCFWMPAPIPISRTSLAGLR